MGWGQKWGAVILKKNDVVRESNPGPLRLKLLPYQLSHRGIVNKIKFINGATNISFAKFSKIIIFQIYGKFVAQMIERVLLIHGSRVQASMSSFCFKSFSGLLELNIVILD